MSADMTNTPQNAVEFDNVSIVFGEKPGQALPLMDAGKDRAEIESATGQVLGVRVREIHVAACGQRAEPDGAGHCARE